MKRFEVGHTYYDTWACNADSISTIKIIKRTAKTVTFERNGKTRRAKLYEDKDGEYIMPDHYSMACVYHAEMELLDEDTEQQVTPAAPAPAPSPEPMPDKYTVAEGYVKMAIAECILNALGASSMNEKQFAFMDALIKNSQ